MTYVGSQTRRILSPLLPKLEVWMQCWTALKILQSKLLKSISISGTPGIFGPLKINCSLGTSRSGVLL